MEHRQRRKQVSRPMPERYLPVVVIVITTTVYEKAVRFVLTSGNLLIILDTRIIVTNVHRSGDLRKG